MNNPAATHAPPEIPIATLIENTVTFCAQGFEPLPQGMLRLHAAGLKVDREDFEDAVTSMTIRDGLLAGALDPYEVLEVTPSVHVRNVRDNAVAEFDDRLTSACTRLARGAA